MTVLFCEAMADFFTQRTFLLRQRHCAKNIFQPRKGMIPPRNPALEDIFRPLTYHDDGVAAVGGFARATKAALEARERRFHFI
jgi:hypothetical protein